MSASPRRVSRAKRRGDDQVTPTVVRDLVVEMVCVTHGDRFSRHKALLGQDCGDAAVRATAEGMVRLAFQQVGGSYDDPGPEHLTRVVNLLAERSLEWGASPDLVFRSHSDVTRRIGHLLTSS